MIKSKSYFLGSLNRIYSANRGFTFRNEEETFDLTLRPDPDVTDRMSFEVVILYEEEKDPNGTFRALLERECIEMDEDEFLLEDFCLSKEATPDSPEVAHAINIINACYAYRLCSCSKYMIRDAHPMCYFCHMIATEEDMKKETCAICHEETPKIGMKPQPCCRQYMHVRCIKKWNDTNPNCPICRASSKLISRSTV